MCLPIEILRERQCIKFIHKLNNKHTSCNCNTIIKNKYTMLYKDWYTPLYNINRFINSNVSKYCNTSLYKGNYWIIMYSSR